MSPHAEAEPLGAWSVVPRYDCRAGEHSTPPAEHPSGAGPPHLPEGGGGRNVSAS
jgi:hypothetical protein